VGGSGGEEKRRTNVRRRNKGRVGEKEQLDVEGRSPTSTWLRVDGRGGQGRMPLFVLAVAPPRTKSGENEAKNKETRR